MYLINLVSKSKREQNGWAYRIVAISSSENAEDSEVYKYLNELDETERDQLITVFEIASEFGPENMPRKLRHTMDVKHRFLMEFIKKRNRVAWFYDEGSLVVCSGCFYKDTKTTPEKAQNRALEAYKDYMDAKKLKKIKDIDR